jgi:hypothetical protein
MQDGVRIYSMSNYHFAFMIFPIMFVIGIICACFVKETHCKELKN